LVGPGGSGNYGEFQRSTRSPQLPLSSLSLSPLFSSTSGSLHFFPLFSVKMIHNGIEQGHLSVFAEVHSILRHQLSLSNFEIADIFEKWSAEGELRGNYLLNIGVKALKFIKGDGVENKEGIVDGIEDKISESRALSSSSSAAFVPRSVPLTFKLHFHSSRCRQLRRNWSLDAHGNRNSTRRRSHHRRRSSTPDHQRRPRRTYQGC